MDLVPGPVGRVTAVPLPHRLPRTELRGKVPAGNAAPVSVNDAFNDLAVGPGTAVHADRRTSAATARSGTTGHHLKQKFATPLKHSSQEPVTLP